MKIGIDQGTTSTRAILYDKVLNPIDIAQIEIKSLYPRDGYVEQCPIEIIDSVYYCINQLLEKHQITLDDIESVSITNQRESIIAWDIKTGQPQHNSIVWQSLQSNEICEKLKQYQDTIKAKTGLIVDSYFSASKIMWLQENVELSSDTVFGTIDSWIIYNLTKEFYTDFSNASRTMILNIHDLKWDEELLKIYKIDKSKLATVLDSNAEFGIINTNKIKGSCQIKGVLGDQQASLYGHQCFKIGDTKITYGTGCFMLINVGEKLGTVPKGMLGTIAWVIDGKATYAIEASIFIGGSLVQWLRDNLEIIKHAQQTETMSKNSNQRIHFIPTFQGVKTPTWNPDVKGALFGMDLATTKDDIAKAAIESIAMQVRQIIDATKMPLHIIQVDGGASNNKYLMQFQADLLKKTLTVNQNPQITSLGSVMITTKSVVLEHVVQYQPNMSSVKADELFKEWLKYYKANLNIYK